MQLHPDEWVHAFPFQRLAPLFPLINACFRPWRLDDDVFASLTKRAKLRFVVYWTSEEGGGISITSHFLIHALVIF